MEAKKNTFQYISPQIEHTFKAIKRSIYLSMNGILAEKLEQEGLHYKKNYGVIFIRLREIAKNYQPDTQLSKLLWNTQERESMILSTMLQPIDDITKEEVFERMKLVQNPELAEQISFNLLRHLPYAEQLTSELIDSKIDWYILTGLLLIPRICQHLNTEQKNLYKDKVAQHINNENSSIKRAAYNALLHIEETSTKPN